MLIAYCVLIACLILAIIRYNIILLHKQLSNILFLRESL